MTLYDAIIVRDVDERALLEGPGLRSVTRPDCLPLERLELPVSYITTVAVLSWRWDGVITKPGSRNVASAVRQAKEMGSGIFLSTRCLSTRN